MACYNYDTEIDVGTFHGVYAVGPDGTTVLLYYVKDEDDKDAKLSPAEKLALAVAILDKHNWGVPPEVETPDVDEPDGIQTLPAPEEPEVDHELPEEQPEPDQGDELPDQSLPEAPVEPDQGGEVPDQSLPEDQPSIDNDVPIPENPNPDLDPNLDPDVDKDAPKPTPKKKGRW